MILRVSSRRVLTCWSSSSTTMPGRFMGSTVRQLYRTGATMSNGVISCCHLTRGMTPAESVIPGDRNLSICHGGKKDNNVCPGNIVILARQRWRLLLPSSSVSLYSSSEFRYYHSTSLSHGQRQSQLAFDNSEHRQKLANDNLYPPPSDESLHKYGLPILVRAAHHAECDRVLCYDTYEHHHHHHHHHPHNSGDHVNKTGAETKKKIRYTYKEVLDMSSMVHSYITSKLNIETQSDNSDSPASQPPPRVAFLCHPSSRYIACQWGSWSAGTIAVPLCTIHRHKELAYVLQDCTPDIIIDGTDASVDHHDGHELKLAAEECGMSDRLIHFTQFETEHSLNNKKGQQSTTLHEDKTNGLGQNGQIPTMNTPAMIVYTSGTTGHPKGVLTSHYNIYHQITDLIQAWEYNENDAMLHFLPLHHVHGIINKLCCSVWAGGSVEFMRFHPLKIWNRLGQREVYDDNYNDNDKQPHHNDDETKMERSKRRPLTLFMAVPTIYAKLLETLPTLPNDTLPRALQSTLHSTMRLMVSGSAALPTSILQRWENLTSHTILERYGMTEFAMALSNPLHGKRVPGYVGLPLPNVEVKIIDEDTGEMISNAVASAMNDSSPSEVKEETKGLTVHAATSKWDRSGELCVRGPNVFVEYWDKPEATSKAFDSEGYFKTGDVAEYDPEVNSYHILGRVSADIIKCGGHKLSSLQIERALLEHPHLEEVVVFAAPDEMYGERVGLICRMKVDSTTNERMKDITMEELQRWCMDRMAPYKIPSRLIVMHDDVPKNAMGKVSKKQLVHLFTDTE